MSDYKYSRADVDYETWYSPWMKALAAQNSVSELRRMLSGADAAASSAARAHLRAIDRSHSMSSCSAARASMRNVSAAAGDKVIAIRGALEIHELFPEHALARDDLEGGQ